MQIPRNIVAEPSVSLAVKNQSVLRRLKDYALVGQKLALQRVIIYSAAVGLAACYYDQTVAMSFFAAIALCEIYDFLVLQYISKRAWTKSLHAGKAILFIYIGTFLSAITIALFCISIALQQGVNGNHFLPLFLLVSASIFAAMNNHHFVRILVMRLVIYVAAVLYIPIRDLWIVRPPLSSEIWLNLFTVIFVLAFILELARNFFIGYSKLLNSRVALQAEHQNALAASEAKTRFLHTVSHELRTPLTSIKGSLDLIISGAVGQVPDKMSRLLEMAQRNSNRLHDLVADLLLLQTSDAGKFSLNRARFDFAEMVNDAVASFQPYADKLGILLKCDISLHVHFVEGDKKRLDQVVTNLLSNAAKFSDIGGTVTVSLIEESGQLVLSVKDEGIGIPEGSEEQIFEEFGQIDSSEERRFQGTGLGLPISRRIVEAHGGKIGYTSSLGVGSTFSVAIQSVSSTEP